MPVPPRPWRPPIPPRVVNIRPIITSSPTTTKIVRPSSPAVKTREPVRTAAVLTARPRPGQTIATRAKIVTRHPPATPIPTLAQPSTRVSDLDALITQQQQEDETKRVSSRSNSLSSSTILDQIQRVLFLPETVKHVRPVRSEELKIFSSQIPSDQLNLTNESLTTLKTDALESIPDPESVADRSEPSSKTSNRARDLSEDSLNEHHHIRRILQKSTWNHLARSDPLKAHVKSFSSMLCFRRDREDTIDRAFLGQALSTIDSKQCSIERTAVLQRSCETRTHPNWYRSTIFPLDRW